MTSNLPISRWLTLLAGSIAAMLAALWVVRRRSTPQAVVIETAALPVSPTIAALPIHRPMRPISAWRMSMSWVIGVTSCVLICIAAVIFQSRTFDSAPLILLIGTIGLATALFLHPPAMLKWTSAPRVHERLRWWQAGVGFLCIAVLTMWNLAGYTIISGHVQLFLLCAGIGFLTYGFMGQILPLERGTLLLVGAITLIALAVRVIGIESALRFFVDEANFADATRGALVSNPPLLARFSGTIAFPWVYPYMESMTVDLFGRNLVGLRMVSALFGTLSIPAVYVLARALFNKPVALAAALLLATFPPHMHFSRISLNNIADPLFGTLALGWLAWGIRTGRRGYFALAGAALGLTQYFYDGGRLLYPPLMLAWLAACAVMMILRRDDRHHRTSGVFVMLLIAFIIAAPIYIVSLSQNAAFSQRFNQESIPLELLSVQDILQRMWDTFMLYIHRVEESFFYFGATPLLLPYAAAPFLVGMVYAVWRALRLDYGGVLLVFWIGITSAGNALLSLPFVSARYVVVFPALAVIAGLGLYVMFQLLVRRERWVRALLTLAVVIIAIAQAVFYFAFHLPLYNEQARVHEDSQDAAFRSANFPGGTQIYIIAEPVAYHAYARAVIWYLRDDLTIEVISPLDFTSEFLENLPRGGDIAFFLLPNDAASRDLLQRYFTVSAPLGSPYPLPPNREFWLFYASRAQNLSP